MPQPLRSATAVATPPAAPPRERTQPAPPAPPQNRQSGSNAYIYSLRLDDLRPAAGEVIEPETATNRPLSLRTAAAELSASGRSGAEASLSGPIRLHSLEIDILGNSLATGRSEFNYAAASEAGSGRSGDLFKTVGAVSVLLAGVGVGSWMLFSGQQPEAQAPTRPAAAVNPDASKAAFADSEATAQPSAPESLPPETSFASDSPLPPPIQPAVGAAAGAPNLAAAAQTGDLSSALSRLKTVLQSQPAAALPPLSTARPTNLLPVPQPPTAANPTGNLRLPPLGSMPTTLAPSAVPTSIAAPEAISAPERPSPTPSPSPSMTASPEPVAVQSSSQPSPAPSFSAQPRLDVEPRSAEPAGLSGLETPTTSVETGAAMSPMSQPTPAQEPLLP
ncbi:hypothetical protein [Leptolyngbya sp. FACHB-261]|uniref:hypothetical protein n=1 Tax=Leptolyngbya sp. FACHB-261 TaxID=2692806 RepID=UPI0016882C96|nr:hypothetical protein [Leptolyngbya sp. FACHB-261]MBD2102108.1 hypothetical protein [Leptolyngbya sp. FACHB-261]